MRQSEKKFIYEDCERNELLRTLRTTRRGRNERYRLYCFAGREKANNVLSCGETELVG